MGIKNVVKRVGDKAGNRVAKLGSFKFWTGRGNTASTGKIFIRKTRSVG